MQRGSKLTRGAENSNECKQHRSPPHLAKPPAEQAPSRGAKSKKRMAAKMRPKRARTQRYTATPRGRVRGKPAYATGAFPTLAPALARRRPRRTSRRAKRPSPQPCPRRLRAECSVATPPRDELQNVSRRWRAGGVEVPSRIRAVPARRHCNHRSIDPEGRARRQRRRVGAVRWNIKGDQARGQGQAGTCRGHGVLVG